MLVVPQAILNVLNSYIGLKTKREGNKAISSIVDRLDYLEDNKAEIEHELLDIIKDLCRLNQFLDEKQIKNLSKIIERLQGLLVD